MKTRISLLALLTSLMLTSCNLFIEDEEDDLSRGLDLYEKTVYTGEGWSEPATEVGDGYEITYQYQDNVKLLTEEMQDYIVSFEVDALYGALGIIDFRQDTPEQFLPRIGEMVTSHETEKMPDGIGAEVIWAGYIDGVYRVCTCSVTLDKIFKKLDGEADIDLGKMGEARPTDESRRASTRADEGDDEFRVVTDGVKIDESEGDDGKYCQFTLPLAFKLTTVKLPKDEDLSSSTKKSNGSLAAVVDKWGIVHSSRGTTTTEKTVKRGPTGSLEVKPTESYMKHRLRVKVFLDGSIIKPMIEIKDTIITHATLHINNGLVYSKTWERKDVFPQLKFGGIVKFKILLGAGITFSAGLFADCAVSVIDSSFVHTKINLQRAASYFGPQAISTFLFNMLESAFQGEYLSDVFQESEAKNFNRTWRFDGSVEGNVSLTPKLSVGVALWTEKISVRGFVKNELKARLNSPSAFVVPGYDAMGLDISTKPGVNVDNNLSTGIGFGVTVNVYEIIKSIQSEAIGIGKAFFSDLYRTLLIEFKGMLYDMGEFDLANSISLSSADQAKIFWESMEETLAKQGASVESVTKDKGLDFDKEFTLKSWPKNLFNSPWFPSVNFKKYKQNAEGAGASGDTWRFEWQYDNSAIPAVGLLPWSGYPALYPCLFIDGGSGDVANGLYFPKNPVSIDANTDIKNLKVSVNANKLTPGKTYMAYPALALSTSDKTPLVFETAQSVMSQAVEVHIKSVEHAENFDPADDDPALKGYHGFKIVAHVLVRGAAKIANYDIFFMTPDEKVRNKTYDGYKGEVKESSDQKTTFFVVMKDTYFAANMMGNYMMRVMNEDGEYDPELKYTNTVPFSCEWQGFDFSESRQKVPEAKPFSKMPQKVIEEVEEIVKNRPFYDSSPIVIAAD